MKNNLELISGILFSVLGFFAYKYGYEPAGIFWLVTAALWLYGARRNL